MKKNKKKIIIISLLGIFCVGLLTLFILFYPEIKGFLTNEEYMNDIRDFIDSFGVYGIFVMMLILILQIVIAFIPGEPFELVCGVLYGTFGGLLVALFSAFVGSTIVFFLVRKFGKKITNRFFTEENLSKYKFLNTAHNRNKLLFIIFLIPGTPKDLLTYFAPLTPISYANYILITTIARIPSLISSTMAGDSLISGNLEATINIYAVTFGLTIIGVLIDNIIQKKKAKKGAVKKLKSF